MNFQFNFLISVIVPTYNSSSTIERIYENIIAQNYKNFELIFIDDCSTDNSVELISNIKDERVKVFRNKNNVGPGYSRNFGLDKAQGKYIAFLDSDDFWEGNKLKKQIGFMEENNILASCTYVSYGFFNSYKNWCEQYTKNPYHTYSNINKNRLLINNKIIMSSLIISKQIDHKFVGLRNRQDLIFCYEILKENSIYSIPEKLVYYDLGIKGISSNKFKMIRANYIAYNYLLKNRIYSIVYLALNIFIILVSQHLFPKFNLKKN